MNPFPDEHAALRSLTRGTWTLILALTAGLVWETAYLGSSQVFASAIFVLAIVLAIVGRYTRARMVELSATCAEMKQTAAEQARRAEKADRVKDEFFATLSHELRTPLNSLLGWARLLASGKLDQVQTARALEAIDRGGRAQSRIIDDLMDVSQIVGGRLTLAPRATLVEPIIEAAVASLRSAATAKALTVGLTLDRSVGPIDVDPDRFRQIVWHLVSNAIKFTPRGGAIDLHWQASDGRVVLSVHDTGVGFPPETGDRLIVRFQQGDSSTTRQYGGLGLGLGIVHHLVALHGGTLTARSRGLNQGATFAVTLPLRHDIPQRPAA